MLYQTFKRIVEAVLEWSIETIDYEEFDKITTDSNVFEYGVEGRVKTILNCFDVTTDYKENVIISNGIKQINIFRTVHNDENMCIGYEYLDCVDTSGKTQIQITAELSAKLTLIMQNSLR